MGAQISIHAITHLSDFLGRSAATTRIAEATMLATLRKAVEAAEYARWELMVSDVEPEPEDGNYDPGCSVYCPCCHQWTEYPNYFVPDENFWCEACYWAARSNPYY